MSRVITLGEKPILAEQTPNSKNTATPKTKEEIQEYVNNMNDQEKKDYIFFLVHKVTQEKEQVLKALKQFNEATKGFIVINEINNTTQIETVYDDLIIPMIRGVYHCTSPMEEVEMKALKKKVMGKLTLTYFNEYLASKK